MTARPLPSKHRTNIQEAMMADKDKDKQAPRGNAQQDDAFAPAPADGNVFPPGAPQTSHGSATGPIHGDAGQSRQQAPKGAGEQANTSPPQDRDAD
jgi:hypothetical protein